MANRKPGKTARIILAASMLLVLVLAVCSCARVVRTFRQVVEGDDGLSDPINGTGRQRNVPTDVTYETLEPSGSFNTEVYEPEDYDIEYIRSVNVYSVWYDVVDDNPMTERYVNKADAFAVKGVFYFTTPLTATFEARLYQDDELILTKEIVLTDNVTAEADFSAGLEGWGTFSAGDYTIELLFEDETVAVTDVLRIEG